MYLLSVLPLAEDHWKALECLLFSLLYACVEVWGEESLKSTEKSVSSACAMGWGADNVTIGESCG